MVDAGELKRCPRCTKTKPLGEFGLRSPDGHQSWCKQCHRERARDWRAANPGLSAARTRKSLYGITPQEFDRLIELQGGRCSICWSEFKGSRDKHVDHCHKTGQIRSIACNNCNSALGMMGEYSLAVWRLWVYSKYCEDVMAGMAVGPFVERRWTHEAPDPA